MTEPRTQAGRDLYWVPFDSAGITDYDDEMLRRVILAIEAEAAQAAVTHCASLEHAAQAAALAEREAEVARLREAVETEWYNGNVDEGARDRILGEHPTQDKLRWEVSA